MPLWITKIKMLEAPAALDGLGPLQGDKQIPEQLAKEHVSVPEYGHPRPEEPH